MLRDSALVAADPRESPATQSSRPATNASPTAERFSQTAAHTSGLATNFGGTSSKKRPAPERATNSPEPRVPQGRALEDLGDEIAKLCAHIHAANYQLLTMIRQFDEELGWGGRGFQTCAHWLSWRTGVSLGPARERVRVAHALAHLPAISDRMARGQFSYSKVRALTRVATAETEEQLVAFAEHGSVAQVERLVRGWRRLDRLEDLDEEKLRHETRKLTVSPDEDGMYVVRGRLDPEVGTLLMRALDVVAKELHESNPQATSEQLRADALGEILREDSSAASGGTEVHAVFVVTEGEEPGQQGCRTDEGVHVPAETAERLCCDASVTVVTKDRRTGAVLDVGRRTRTISGRLRRALRTRDGGHCRFPGCQTRRCDAHHVQHWAKGGHTKLDNLLSLCRFHHRAVHEGGYQVLFDPLGEATFLDPAGAEVVQCPEVGGVDWFAEGVGSADSAGSAGEGHLHETELIGRGLGRWGAGVGISENTTIPRGRGSVDYGWALDGLWRPKGRGRPGTETLEEAV